MWPLESGHSSQPVQLPGTKLPISHLLWYIFRWKPLDFGRPTCSSWTDPPGAAYCRWGFIWS